MAGRPVMGSGGHVNGRYEPPLRRRDIDAERTRRWRALMHGDIPDLAAGRHTRDDSVPEPPPAPEDRAWLEVTPLRRQRAARRDWRDSAWFDALLAAACGAVLLTVTVGLVLIVVYTLTWSLT